MNQSILAKAVLFSSLTISALPTAKADSVAPFQSTIQTAGRNCLDVQGDSLENSAKVIVWRCNNGANQKWIFEHIETDEFGGDWYSIRNVNSGKCLDVKQDSMEAGAEVIQYTCNENFKNQQWWFQWTVVDQDLTGGLFHVRHSGQCLDVRQGLDENGTQLIQWPCNTTFTNQTFLFHP